MKRLLTLLTAIGFTTTTAVPVVACCKNTNNSGTKQDLGALQLKQINLPIPKATTYTSKQANFVINMMTKNISDQINEEKKFKSNIQSQDMIDYTDDFTTNIADFIKPDETVNIGDSGEIEVNISANPNSKLLKGKTNATIKFNPNTQLTSVVTNTNLGKFQTTPSASEIIGALGALNPQALIDEDEVEVLQSGIKVDGAAVKALDSTNSLYEGQINVTYEVVGKKQLSEVITKTALGMVNDSTNETIVNTINQLNPEANLKTTDVTIVVNGDNNGATLTATETSDYQGSVDVTFTIRKQLSAIVTNLDLGIIANNDETTILAAVNAKNANANLKASDVTIVVNGANNGATLTATPSSIYQGSVTVTFTIKTALDSVVKVTTLGPINKADSPTILAAVNQVNIGLKLTSDDVTIKVNDDNKSASLTATENSIYQGSVTVTFTIKATLESVVKVTTLGNLDEANNDTILKAVNQANSGLNLTSSDVTIAIDNEKNSATLTATPSSIYQGSVTVTFTIRVELSSIITNLDLGIIENNQDATILDAVNAKNPSANLKASDVTIKVNGDNKSASLTATPTSNYQGSVTVTFTIKIALDSVVKVTTLGNLDEANNDTILKAVNQANNGLNLTTNDVTIVINGSNNGATLTATVNSNYNGFVNVTFTIRTQLSSVVTITNLGPINKADEATILAAVNTKNTNANLNASDVNIQINDNNSATLTAAPTSSYQGSVTVTFTIKATLESVVKVTTLGNLDEANNDTILKAVNQVNNGLNLTTNDVTIAIDNDNKSATLTATTSSIYQGSVTVTFTIKTALDSVVKVTALGPINKADSATILVAVNQVNNGLKLTTDDVTIVVNGDNNGATLTATPNSNYKGFVNVTFIVKKQLSSIVTSLDLGAVENTEDATILAAVNAKNPSANLKAADITIVVNGDNKSAILTATPASAYQGSVTVTFSVKPKLNSVVTNLNLGYINDTNLGTILAAINAQNPSANLKAADVTIEVVGNSSAVVTATDSSIYQGSVTVTFTVKAQLSSIVTNLDLGALDNLTDDDILAAVNAKNPNANLKAADVDIEITGDNEATLTAKETSIYQGTVTVKFTIKTTLSSVVTVTNLGSIDKADSATILAAVNAKNPNAKLKDTDVKIGIGGSQDNATLTATKGSIYEGTVNVTFTVKAQLSSIVTNLDLGALDNLTDDDILAAVNAKNPNANLKAADVDIEITGDNEATLTAKETSIYQGTVTVKFTIKTTLSSVVTVTNLGSIDKADSATILAAVNAKNPNAKLKDTDVTIGIGGSQDNATLTATKGSIYEGTVNVTFTVKAQLSTIVTNLDLGTIDNLTDDDILAAVNAKNPNANLKAADVDIEITGDNEATLTAKETSIYQGTVTVTFTMKNK